MKPPCQHLGKSTGRTRNCETCQGVEVKVFGCDVHGSCTLAKKVLGEACCQGCGSYMGAKSMEWAVGLMTVPQRRETLLPRTLQSLAKGGFDKPRLFVDGGKESDYPGMDVTCRNPRIKPFGNWVLGLHELVIRQPDADRYVMFQDDLQCSLNLRQYLERSPLPGKGYANLFSFPMNEELGEKKRGWFPSNQRGKGAVGLVFDNEAAVKLLTHFNVVTRTRSKERGWRSVDGCVITCLQPLGWIEWCHNPSLLQHVGDDSTIDKSLISTGDSETFPAFQWPASARSRTFQGEGFDLLSLLCLVDPGSTLVNSSTGRR